MCSRSMWERNVTSIQSYHRRRELAEEAMATRAASSVARIVHGKLAVLHGAADARDAKAILAAGQDAPARSVER